MIRKPPVILKQESKCCFPLAFVTPWESINPLWSQLVPRATPQHGLLGQADPPLVTESKAWLLHQLRPGYCSWSLTWPLSSLVLLTLFSNTQTFGFLILIAALFPTDPWILCCDFSLLFHPRPWPFAPKILTPGFSPKRKWQQAWPTPPVELISKKIYVELLMLPQHKQLRYLFTSCWLFEF